MKVLASWDNGGTADLRMAELMSKYNIPTIFYWTSVVQNNYKEISKNFEIGSNGLSGRSFKKMSIQQIGNEVHESKKILQDITNQAIDSFAYPKHSVSSLSKSLVKGAGYKNARSNVPCWLEPGDDFAIQCTVQIGIDRIEYGEKSWELFADEMLKRVNESSVYHIFGNSLDVEISNDWEALENLLKKLNS